MWGKLPRMRAFFVFVSLFGMAGIAAMPVRAHAQSDIDSAAALRGEITAMIGDARCNNLVNCRILALGSSPCGGAEEYVAYSVWSTNGEDLRSKAMEFNFLREEILARGGAAGSCEMLRESSAACVNGRCVAVQNR